MTTVTSAPMTAAAARQLHDDALQSQLLADCTVNAICEQLDAIEFDDALNISAYAAAVHAAAQRHGLGIDEPPVDAIAEIRAAFTRLETRLDQGVRDLEPATYERDGAEVLSEEIDAAGAAAS